MDTSSAHFSLTRVKQHIQSRFNPLRGITPQKVTRWIDDFSQGRFREAAWAMERIEESDYTLAAVAQKRKSATSGLDWEIVINEGAEETYGEKAVQDQREFLLNFYNNLTARHALEQDRKGGMRLLINQMMDAVGKRYAAHEIQWRPSKDGSLTAELWHVPLYFFEAETGKLRFLPYEGASVGQELEPLSWMVTCGQGIMIPCMVAYIFKTLSLKDWLTYSERNGMPAFTMATDAAPGSPEWDAAVEAIKQVASDFAGVHSAGSELKVTDLKGAGQVPYPALVEKMERAMSTLWRGGDLSTMSGENKLGASLQQDETDLLQQDDVDMINDTLNAYLDRPALKWKFGDAPQLVYFKLQAPDRLDEKAEMEKVRTAVELGLPVAQAWLSERFGIPMASAGDELLQKPSTGPANPLLPIPASNEATDQTAREHIWGLAQLNAAQRTDMKSVMEEIEKLYEIEDPEELIRAVRETQNKIKPNLIPTDGGRMAKVMEEQLTRGFIDGIENKPI